MDRLKSRENNSPLQPLFGQIYTQKNNFSALVGLDHFVREERKGMERNGNTKKERQWKEVGTKLEREWIGKELDRNTRNRKK